MQLVQHGAELLECKVWRNGAMLWSAELKIEIDPKTGIVALPSQSNADGSGRNASAVVAHQQVQVRRRLGGPRMPRTI